MSLQTNIRFKRMASILSSFSSDNNTNYNHVFVLDAVLQFQGTKIQRITIVIPNLSFRCHNFSQESFKNTVTMLKTNLLPQKHPFIDIILLEIQFVLFLKCGNKFIVH